MNMDSSKFFIYASALILLVASSARADKGVRALPVLKGESADSRPGSRVSS